MSQVLAMAHKIEELECLLAVKSRIESSHNTSASTPQYVPSIEGARTSIPMDHEANANLRDVMRAASTSESRDSPHYPSTSAIEPAISGDGLMSTANSTPSADTPKMDGDRTAFWKEAAIDNCASLLQLPAEIVRQLLSTLWD